MPELFTFAQSFFSKKINDTYVYYIIRIRFGLVNLKTLRFFSFFVPYDNIRLLERKKIVFI